MLDSSRSLLTSEGACAARALPLAPRPRRCAVLLNANAKRVDDRVVQDLRSVVRDDDLFVSTCLRSAETCVRRILETGHRALLLGGGDGTIAAGLNLLARVGAEPGHRRRALPDLGVLRLGTGNALASLSRAGRPLEDATRVLAGDALETSPLRVLEVEGHGELFPFGSLGYDAQLLNDYVNVVEGARTAWGRRLAKSVAGYVYAVGTRTIPAELRRPATEVRVVSRGRASLLDPETLEEIPLDASAPLFEGVARAVLVGTTPYYGYGFRVLPYAGRRGDRFHLRVSTASIPYLIGRLPQLWRGTLRSSRLVDFLVEDVEVETSQPLPLQLSGDAWGQTDRARIRLSDRTFRLLRM